MIASKGQTVRLVTEPRVSATLPVAKVLSIVYAEQPEGSRGVQLDRELGGSKWWLESQLEAAT